MRKHLAAILAVVTLLLVPSAIAFASYTWTDVDGSSGSWTALAVSDAGLVAYSARHDLVSNNGRIWKTVDGGASWAEMSSPVRRNWFNLATSGDGQTVIGFGQISNVTYIGPLHMSSDGGASWAPQEGAGVREWTGVAMSRNGSKIFAVAKMSGSTASSLRRSSDGGATWSNAGATGLTFDPAAANWSEVALSSDGSTVIVGLNGGGVYLSSDFGDSWSRALNLNTVAWTTIKMSGDGRYIMAKASWGPAADNGVWVSRNTGASWTRLDPIADAAGTEGDVAMAISRDGSTMAYGYIGHRVRVSRDGGVSWQADPDSSTGLSEIGLSESGERLITVTQNGIARFATSTTTTTTTTTTTVAPTTTVAATTTAASTSTAAVSSTTVVDSPAPVVTPSMVEAFKPKALVKSEEIVAGDPVTVRISGFRPFELVSIGFDDSGAVSSQAVGDTVRAFAGRKVLVTVRADATGTISVTTKLPESVSGAVTLWAYGRESKVGFRQQFVLGELPQTGSEGSGANLMLAASLLASGVAFVGLRRRLRG